LYPLLKGNVANEPFVESKRWCRSTDKSRLIEAASDLMRRVSTTAAGEGNPFKECLVERAEASLYELRWKGILPKGKGAKGCPS
jgi:hypothetical protein